MYLVRKVLFDSIQSPFLFVVVYFFNKT